MKRFNKVTIIGVGLIGGSIGLAMKKKRLARRIVGVTKHKQSLQKACKLGAIDQGSLNLRDAVRGSDLVILATPIRSIIRITKSIVKYLDKGCILTDVGSTKGLVVKELEKILPKDIHFVGGHPLAGSEQRGVDSASADLFKDSFWIITRTKKTKPQALARTRDLLKALQANVLVISPNEHDKVVSEISHLPHILASCLVNSVRGKYLPLAASGFKDATRVASSDPTIWEDICLTNRKMIIKAIEEFISNLSALKVLIRKEDGRGISREFKRAKKKRDDYCH